ncbi:DEAD/DEAH box helicase [Sporolactobacillus spathodeae]|uniref:Competence protein ComFA n=1 Tax=Sporolactobacillus spathodeae TaxID=1465502 RepID=A0ABS2Q6R4_9BACL|nr:helicase-related protein [Sporolactobacillus spathodeae]MBM7657266.1 competence protein ComFA [Sporolactobacillus spathodeae]
MIVHEKVQEQTDFFSPNPDIQQFLFGKEYRLEDLPFSKAIVREHIAHGFIKVKPGIEPVRCGVFTRFITQKKWHCNRCGNEDPRAFARCRMKGCDCVYCRHCLNMGGVIRSYGQLASWAGPEPAARIQPWGHDAKLCAWQGSLSAQQRSASEKLDQALTAGRSFLIWAVAGAGKTELLFPAIEHALLAGKRVALATPRTDVVKELLPRFRAAFPPVPISALYGGSEEKVPGAPLVLATTHQLIHFVAYFDLIFIDEVDAFPFHTDPMLPFAVEKSTRSNAPIAYLTATPPNNLCTAFARGKIDGVRIPGRYHGFPLPTPEFRWIGNWRTALHKQFLPHAFKKWVAEKMRAKVQLFLFVPSLAIVHALTELLQREGFGRVAGVHSEDPDRHAKVAYFRQGKLDILVTTTILERGVTVPGVEVGVFGADDSIFDERALVQIAGRVGRSANQPSGDVLFFHNGRTLQMLKARQHIEMMNQEAGHVRE